MPSDSKRVQELFLKIVKIPQADRTAALGRECGKDVELRRRVEALLHAHDESGSFLENPTVTVYQTDLAGVHGNIGILQMQLGRSEQTVEEFRKAQEIQQRLADANPDTPSHAKELAGTLNNIAWVLSQAGKTDEALEANRKALEIREKLARALPTVPAIRRDVGMSRNSIGDALAASDRWAEALASYEAGRDIHQELVKVSPTSSDFQNGLAFSLAGLGRAQFHTGRAAEAAASLRRAIEVRATIPALSLEAGFDLARTHGLLAALAAEPASGVTADEGRTEADRAMDLLRRAVADGWDDRKALGTDKDLDVLRPRADFKRLLAELEEKSPAKPEKKP